VTDIDAVPFEASYLRESGGRRPATPARQSFWAASTQGRGTQTLDWHMKDGDWSVVVMNADGSRGVAADVSAGAKISFLDELGWISIATGGALMTGALGLTVLGVRPPRNRPPHAQVGGWHRQPPDSTQSTTAHQGARPGRAPVLRALPWCGQGKRR
jgi:hypothetical protein